MASAGSRFLQLNLWLYTRLVTNHHNHYLDQPSVISAIPRPSSTYVLYPLHRGTIISSNVQTWSTQRSACQRLAEQPTITRAPALLHRQDISQSWRALVDQTAAGLTPHPLPHLPSVASTTTTTLSCFRAMTPNLRWRCLRPKQTW